MNTGHIHYMHVCIDIFQLGMVRVELMNIRIARESVQRLLHKHRVILLVFRENLNFSAADILFPIM